MGEGVWHGVKGGKAIQFRICLLGQEFGCKEFVRDGQSRAIGGISFAGQSGPKTRSQAQKPKHKDLEPKWPKPRYWGNKFCRAIRFRNAFAVAEIYV
ncbi:hypothetical protein BGL52_03495 [Lacticaseibacillus casei]|uniref:Uncharacterized protein n=1 Tax=Lacticaseibacillus casei TaxID=1582 RepID=A0AAN1EY93_LACCA|nr:hypothetical protein BGL52_03495 [Lacticaseibacillus casei]